ncbi:hypothetical protein LCGC14_1852290 [marine sediment metagenome]|uniref:VCBS repeat-containing protein n=1 Tax=marine sediment metagenome TaxID=412755 RepID=A0A0F9GY74_9ZZZZ
MTVDYVIFEGSATTADIDVPEFYERTGDSNPFSQSHIGAISANSGSPSSLSIGDLDNDGDLDALLSYSNLSTYYLENVGTALIPEFQLNTTDNPLAASSGQGSAFGDVDADGDLDVIQVSQTRDGIVYYENQLTQTGTLGFIQKSGTDNPFNNLTVTNVFTPVLVDIDDDGQLELFVTTGGVDSYFCEADLSGVYSVNATNPLSGLHTSTREGLNFTDFDGDNDLDIFVGSGTVVRYLENVGSAASPQFVQRTGAGNPAAGITTASLSAKPFLADLNGDGSQDLVATDLGSNINVRYFRRALHQEAFIAGGATSVTVSIPVVNDVIGMVDRAEYKRRQAPPGIKITPRAFGRDRRLPITNRFRG